MLNTLSTRHWSRLLVVMMLFLALATACGESDQEEVEPAPTAASLFATATNDSESPAGADGEVTSDESGSADAQTTTIDAMGVLVDATEPLGTISPLVYGLSGASAEYMQALQPTLNSWGGNPNTRYNWRLGNAWNAGSDWFYRNTDYGYDPDETGLPAHDNFVEQAQAEGAEVRLAVTTLGWVARNSDPDTCSFPLPNGECGDGGGANCRSPGEMADPTVANVRSTPEDVREWVQHMVQEQGYDIRFIAMDNEPELWGYTHYDVHPECTTYQEILDKYLTYATAVREVAPDVELTGPVTCCWEFYFHSASGSRDERQYDDMPFIPWFLQEVRRHDEEAGQRTLDVLDIHYYPEGLYNDEADPETAAHRLRSTRSLWDPGYVDESWIREQIRLIPRMNEWIEEYYPGTRLGLSEWNWGADETMNGALAIADVLGILGREEVYFASYWRFPPVDSPGYFAFKMYTNYDDAGSRFQGAALGSRSENEAAIGTFAALDDDGTLRVMLLNKLPDRAHKVRVSLEGLTTTGNVELYRYDEANPQAIVQDTAEVVDGSVVVDLPAYSINLLVLDTE